ncbi:TRAP transporter large permease [Aquamicrobium defluvii]|uniref:TRAP transporter large permease protein n=1 Tax=Aquamicrobium defluvii TaxID=69279 RepID=A0A011TI03_9HYPH|nr:TRAP transporter large permease [Aquamicrobium defluvii]EXL03612.1 C4-dicarboxylate ABC transporter permease [Aquamicrobium defluvii]EZQ15277.1 C4-dicarboxylate ABC transporter permease [Halopseudomonas bauzanensis]TDR32104.1 C4-dicarboxylate transporter DctM subunit [Aquamicrobium defluvii]
MTTTSSFSEPREGGQALGLYLFAAVLALLALLGALGLTSLKVSGFGALIVVLLYFRLPIILVVGVLAAGVHALFASNSDVEYLMQDMWFALDREVLLSVPMFILAGALMARGSIAKSLINCMSAFTAGLPGGLAVATTLACAVFAAISGSSIVTMLAVGSIAYPAMIRQGYDEKFSIGLIAAAGSLGIMIPPSIAMILYGIMTETSITRLFTGGIKPGLLLAGMLVLYSVAMNLRRNSGRFSASAAARSVVAGFWALMMPVILLGGIYGGYFSPTEAAAVSLLYAALVELFIYREMKLADYKKVVVESLIMLGRLLPLVAIASSLNTILDYEGVTQAWVVAIGQAIENPVLLMIAVNLLLLGVGCIMEVSSAMVVLSPLLMPIMVNAGYDPVHFGVVMTANLEIGYLTPPVGLNLVVAMVAFKKEFSEVVRSVLPFLVLMLIWLVIVCVYPAMVV